MTEVQISASSDFPAPQTTKKSPPQTSFTATGKKPAESTLITNFCHYFRQSLPSHFSSSVQRKKVEEVHTSFSDWRVNHQCSKRPMWTSWRNADLRYCSGQGESKEDSLPTAISETPVTTPITLKYNLNTTQIQPNINFADSLMFWFLNFYFFPSEAVFEEKRQSEAPSFETIY